MSDDDFSPIHVVTCVVLACLLLSPWIAKLGGLSSDTLENRAAAEWPEVEPAEFLDTAVYRQVGDYIEDRAPLRRESLGLIGSIGEALQQDSSTRVLRGPDDQLILAEDFTLVCGAAGVGAELAGTLDLWEAAAAEGDKEILFVVAPNKSTVLDSELTGRADAAAWCARQFRTEIDAALATSSVVLDPVGEIVERHSVAEPAYFPADTHWTYETGGFVASMIVDRLAVGLWDPDSIAAGDSTLVRGDVAAMIGLDRELEVNQLETQRPGASTTVDEIDLGGTESVRRYRTTGVDLIEGNTVIVFDSMMHFMEAQLAPYFADVTFIHWHDIGREDLVGEIAAADRLIVESVERYLPQRSASMARDPLLIDGVTDALTANGHR